MVRKVLHTAAYGVALFAASACMTSCDDDKIYTLDMPESVIISDINLNVSPELPLAIGMDSVISYTVGPDNARNLQLCWTSSNELVATVSRDGVISAVGLGKSVITVTPEVGFGGENTVKSITVQVIKEVVEVTSVTFDNTETELYEGDRLQLNPVLFPANHTYSHLYWTSSDESIANVDENGLVTGIKEGNVTITAATHDGGGSVGTYTIKVKRSIAAQEVVIAPVNETLYLFQRLQMNVTTTPSEATLATIDWTSDDESIISVDRNGVVLAKGFGTTIVTATCTATGYSSKVELTVEPGFYIWDATNGFPNLSTQNNLGQLKVVGDLLQCTVTTDAAARVCPQLCPYSTLANTGSFHFKNFPFVAVMADDVTMKCTWQINIVNIEKTINLAKNMTKKDLGNGKAIFYFDCSELADFAGDDGMTAVRAFVFKIGTSPVESFNIHSIRMFRSEEEMNSIFK